MPGATVLFLGHGHIKLPAYREGLTRVFSTEQGKSVSLPRKDHSDLLMTAAQNSTVTLVQISELSSCPAAMLKTLPRT
jgi:hypothetical protein